MDKQTEITMFSSTAIALYGYDQGEFSSLYAGTLPLTDDLKA
jgi:hypothetical protein